MILVEAVFTKQLAKAAVTDVLPPLSFPTTNPQCCNHTTPTVTFTFPPTSPGLWPHNETILALALLSKLLLSIQIQNIKNQPLMLSALTPA